MSDAKARAGASGAAHATSSAPPRERAGLFADLLTLGLAAALLARLAPLASRARFTSDECYHAFMSEWIAAHGGLPRQVDGLYDGFKYFYPPLFHVIGAAFVTLFGPDSFRYVNVALLAALLAATWIGLARLRSRGVARLGVLLLLAYPALRAEGVHLFVEALSALLAVASILALWALLERPGAARAIACGVCAGLFELAKQSALAFLAILGGLAVLAALRGRRAHAKWLAAALGIAVACAAPFWARNFALFGSPLYPLLGPDIHPLLARLNRVEFTPGPRSFVGQTVRDAGAVLAAVLAAAFVAAIPARRRTEARLFLAGAALLPLAPFVPMLDPRHMIPVLSCLAVLGAAVLGGALRSPAASKAVQLALALAVGIELARMPDVRAPFDLEPGMEEAFAAVRAHVPPGARILSLETYDTFYYTGRAATWPIPYGQPDPPFEFFFDREPDRVLVHLRSHALGFLLVPHEGRGESFGSGNFPKPFMRALDALVERGEARVTWSGASRRLVEVAPAGPAK